MKNKHYVVIISLIAIVFLTIVSLCFGEYKISVNDTFKALVGFGNTSDTNIIWNVRVPRLVVGLLSGATLALSGYLTKVSLKNPLADSGVLGIQTGATTFSLLIILIAPFLYNFLPIFAFMGGLLAFTLVILFSYKRGLKSINLILSGVAVNAFFAALIGLLTVLNSNKLQGALNYLNGSLVNLTFNEMIVILIYSVILIVITFFFIPILKILDLDDLTILNLGKNPNLYRIGIALFAVLLASITASYVGVISFLGIIVPSLVTIIIKDDTKYQMIISMLFGGIFVVGCDLSQKLILTPLEIPVGLIIGIISAPIFLLVLRGGNHD